MEFKIGDIVTPTYSDMELVKGRNYIIENILNEDNNYFLRLRCMETENLLIYAYHSRRLVLAKKTIKQVLEEL